MAKKVVKKDKARKDEIAKASARIIKHQSEEDTPGTTDVADGRAVGVDVGTSKIVFSEEINGKINYSSQFNAFIPVEYSKFTENILKQNRINYSKIGNSLTVYGDGAEIFANMMNAETRRPMRNGLLNPKEIHATEIIKGIIDDLVLPARTPGARLCFSIPGVPTDSKTDIIYHEAILKRHLEEKGYKAKSISEGMAVVLAELENENFTGCGISAGGGMCNVCLAYLSVPLISFSLYKGGDYIDDAVASVTSEVSTRIRSIKENELDLTKNPRNEIEDALNIYYDDLIVTLVKTLKESIDKTSKMPRVDRSIPIVLSGGTSMPKGFRDRFEKYLKQVTLPLEIDEIRIAKDPLNATSKGALISAMYDD